MTTKTPLITHGLDTEHSLCAAFYPTVEILDRAIEDSQRALERSSNPETRAFWEDDLAAMRHIRANHDAAFNKCAEFYDNQPEGVCRYCQRGNAVCTCP